LYVAESIAVFGALKVGGMGDGLDNNRINSDWQIRCAPLPAGYAERSAIWRII